MFYLRLWGWKVPKASKSIQKHPKAPARIKEIHHHSSNYSSKIVNITKRSGYVSPFSWHLEGLKQRDIFLAKPPCPRAFQLCVTLHKVGATELVAKVACLCIAEETRIPRDLWSSRVFFPTYGVNFLKSSYYSYQVALESSYIILWVL